MAEHSRSPGFRVLHRGAHEFRGCVLVSPQNLVASKLFWQVVWGGKDWKTPEVVQKLVDVDPSTSLPIDPEIAVVTEFPTIMNEARDFDFSFSLFASRDLAQKLVSWRLKHYNLGSS